MKYSFAVLLVAVAAAVVVVKGRVTHQLKKRDGSGTTRVLQCVAVCCSVLQCVVVCCSVLQCVAVCCKGRLRYDPYAHKVGMGWPRLVGFFKV